MLDLQLAALLGPARPAGAPDLCDLPVEVARAVYRQLNAASFPPAEPVAQRDLMLPGAAESPSLRLRTYAPAQEQRQGQGPWPVVLWFHGGGYMLGDLETYDLICGQLCLDAQALVVALDYRLAPEHPFPAAFDDAWSALQWVASAAGRQALGESADTSRLALAGDSAGAVLALSTSLRAREAGGPAVAFQALAYPPAGALMEGPFASRERHAGGPTLTRRAMEHFNHTLRQGAREPLDHRLTPLKAPSLAGLPPTLLQLAALDPLRDEGLALARRLGEEGTPVTLVEYHGLAHGYLGQGGAVRAARWAQRQFGECLRDALHAPL